MRGLELGLASIQPDSRTIIMATAQEPSDDTVRTLRATVHGRVQGVGYRFFVRETARSLGISGYVRNQPDGTVFVTARAQLRKLEQLLSLLRRGPSSAHVTNIEC